MSRLPKEGMCLGVSVPKDLIKGEIKNDLWKGYFVAHVMKQKGQSICECGRSHTVMLETFEYFIILAVAMHGGPPVIIPVVNKTAFLTTVTTELGLNDPPFKLMTLEDGIILIE